MRDKPPRRVAIYRSQLLPTSETFVRSQALALKTWSPVLVGRNRLEDGLALDDLELRIVPSEPGRAAQLTQTLRFWLGNPDARLVRTLHETRASLVHCHFGTEATDIWPSVRAAGLPMIVTLHGYDINTFRSWWESGKGGLRRMLYPRRLLALARDHRIRFVAVSKAIQARAVAFGIPASRISVAYIGVDTNFFAPSRIPITERPKQILFVGRMVEKKAPLLLIRAFASVRQMHPTAKLLMVGDGPLRNAAQQLASSLGLPVTFTGTLPSNKVVNHMHASRVLCLPSITASNGDAEGLGLVVLEAQACGLPVVTSAKGGSSEAILDGLTGYRFDEGDRATLADRLTALLDDDALLANQSIEAVSFVRRRFDIAECAGELEAIFDEAYGATL
jgi:glycosyltransferase involved in cell wall biosynthesis